MWPLGCLAESIPLMKRPRPFPQGSHGSVSCVTLMMLVLLPFLPLSAATLTWDADGTAGGATGGTGTWSTTSHLLWNNAGTMQAWNNAVNNLALFGGTAGTVTLGSPVAVVGMTFNTTGYALEGNGQALTFGGPITVTNAGTSVSIDAAMTLSAATSFAGAGNLTFEATSSIAGGGTGTTALTTGFVITKNDAGTTILDGSITNTGSLNVTAGVLTLSGSVTRDIYNSSAGFNVTGGILNITGTLGTSTAIPTGQSGFSGNSVTNFSGIGFFSGAGSTFRIGEGTAATFNVTAGTLTLGMSSAGLVVGRSNIAGKGLLHISGGQFIVTGSTLVRIGAGYSDGESSGASVMTLSGTGLFETGLTAGTILLGSNLAGNTTSTGTLNLNGGTLATLRTITGGTVGASIINLNGGTLKANGTSVTLATSLTTVNVRDGGGIIDTNGFNISIAKSLTHSSIEGDSAIDGGLTKLGLGTLTLTGTDANTFNGTTLVNAGGLDLSKTAGVNAIAGNITIGDGTTSALLRLINADQLADTSVITLNGTGVNAGVFRLNGKAETVGGLSSAGGAGFVENESATSATLTLNNSSTQTFSGVLRNGTLAGTLSLAKNGAGTQILNGASTYTGTTTINAGTLQFGADHVIQSTSNLIIAAAGATPATFDLNGHAWNAGSVIFYNATSTASSQGIINIGTGGLLTLGSNVTVNNDNQPLSAQITGGTLDLGAATRTFAIADSSNAIADLSIASDITSTGGAFGLTKTGAGTLRLSGNVTVGGTLSISGGVLELAGTLSNGTATTAVGSASTPGVLRLVSGANLSTTTLAVAAAASYKGALVISGGALTITTTSSQAGVALGGTGYGGLFLSGGTINTNRVDSGDGTTAASISILQVSGGTLNTARYIMFRNERWEFTVTGGQVLRTGEHIALGFRSGANAASATTTAQGVMTVAGGLVNNTGFTITLGQQNDASALGAAHVNLNAGTLITNQITHYNGTGTAMQARVNFNGGLLKASISTSLIATSGSAGTGSITTYVNGAFGNFAGGAMIDSNSFNVTLPAALLAPTGDGVSSIPVTAGGSGYMGAPYVEISGGGGSGATASAVVDLDPSSPTYGQLLSILVTNPGNGYTSAPTINLLGGGGSGATVGTAATAANTSGGLTKTGAGTLTLSGASANTFTGTTTITAGELSLSKSAGITAIAGDITLGNGTAPAVMKLINSDQIADSSVITFNGSGASAGIFRLNNKNETLGGLSSTDGAGIVENESGSAATSTLNVNIASGSQSFSGILRNGDGTGTDGTLALSKSGAGTQVLGGTNTYTGATMVNAGTLQISAGGTTGVGTVSVQNGAVLVGTGIIRGSSFTAINGSTVHAGDGVDQGSYGTLIFTPVSGSGSFDFQSGSSLILGINPGGNSDLINFVGTGTNTLLFNGSLNVTASAFVPTTTEVFDLINWSGLTSAPTFASRYNHTGQLFGNGDEASGLDLPDISGSGYAWDISNFTTNGSIALIVVVPEPSRMLLLSLSLAMLIIRRSR
jgi:autotransporter-associated beta strand protein